MQLLNNPHNSELRDTLDVTSRSDDDNYPAAAGKPPRSFILTSAVSLKSGKSSQLIDLDFPGLEKGISISAQKVQKDQKLLHPGSSHSFLHFDARFAN